VLDPDSRWDVVLQSLSVSTTTYSGSAWDAFGGAPDPRVYIRVGSDTARPTLIDGPDDVFSITYSTATARARDQRAQDIQRYLDFEVEDEDFSSHDFIGRCVYRGLGEDVFFGEPQVLRCGVDAATMNSGFTLVWYLEPR
jgi:hypothetical protein